MWALSALAVGAGLGIAVDRGGFCIHSAFREAAARTPGPALRAYGVALALQMLVLYALQAAGTLVVPLPPVHAAGAAVGGLVFGFGMILARG